MNICLNGYGNDNRIIGEEYLYNKEQKVFVVEDKNKNVLMEIDSVLPLIDDYNPNDFDVKILHNTRPDHTESCIYQVKVGGVRIGWIMPIQSLHSTQHVFSNDEYYLKYAYVAWVYLLMNCDAEVEDLDTFDLFNCYPDDIALLVLDQNNCSTIEGFDYDDYVVSLFEYGYSENGVGNVFFDEIKIDKHINLKHMSKELNNIPYINNLFKTFIPRDDGAVSRFYIYYQIIELLIAKVFDDEFFDFLELLKNDTIDLYTKKDELNYISNERNRINRLFNTYCRVDSQILKSLGDNCEQLLLYTDSKVAKSEPEKLYQVRCLLVHRMYLVDDNAEKILGIIDDLFLAVLIQLLHSFKKP